MKKKCNCKKEMMMPEDEPIFVHLVWCPYSNLRKEKQFTSLWNKISLFLGGTSETYPEWCKICGEKTQGNFITGYWLPCEKTGISIHDK